MNQITVEIELTAVAVAFILFDSRGQRLIGTNNGATLNK